MGCGVSRLGSTVSPRPAGSAFRAWSSSGKLQSTQRSDIIAESKAAIVAGNLASNGLASVAVKGASAALSSLPFGEGLAAIIEHIYDAANAVRTNVDNCRKLLRLVQVTEEVLFSASAEALQRNTAAVQMLYAALQEADALICAFGPKSWLRRVLSNSNDKGDFEDAHRRVLDSLQVVSVSCGLTADNLPRAQYDSRDGDALVKKLCEIGGSDDPRQALAAATAAGRIQDLVSSLPLSQQVVVEEVTSALDDLRTDLKRELREARDSVINQVRLINTSLNQVKVPQGLPPALKDFWLQSFNKESVPWKVFTTQLELTLGTQTLQRLGRIVQQRLAVHGEAAGAGSGKDGDAMEALEALLHQTFDLDHDGLAELDEFYLFYMRSTTIVPPGEPPPESLLGCLEATARYYDISFLSAAERALLQQLAALLKPLQYEADVNALLARTIPGSRQWLMDEFDSWLEQPSTYEHHKAFILYGGPGIGKSTFAAQVVRQRKIAAYHFCKHTDSQRSDPMRLVMNLAYQLAVSLPAMRAYLLLLGGAAITAAGASVKAMFETLLLDPLTSLGARGLLPDSVLVLVDALDEAQGGFSTTNPFVVLVRDSFPLLPPSVRFIITTRPEEHIVRSFKYKFNPHEILPADQRHKADVRDLLRCRLGPRMDPGDVEAGLKLLLDKSEGVFVYISQALEKLDAHQGPITLSLLRKLPDGLGKVYKQYFTQYIAQDTSVTERALAMAIMEVLVAAREPPLLSQLIDWLAVEQEAVVSIVPKMGSLFYVCNGRLHCTHKTLYDWVVTPEAGEFQVDAAAGHQRIAAFILAEFEEGAYRSYGLRHIITHLCLAARPVPGGGTGAAGARAPTAGPGAQLSAAANATRTAAVEQRWLRALEGMLGNMDYWQAAFRAEPGQLAAGPLVVSDLIQLYKGRGSGAVHDVLRWMQRDMVALIGRPAAVVQLALNTPPASFCCVRAEAYLAGRAAREGDGGEEQLPLAKVVELSPPRWLNRPLEWPRFSMKLHALNGVQALAFSPDGSALAACTEYQTVELFDAATGQHLAVIPGHQFSVLCVTFHPRDAVLASGSEDFHLCLWDTHSGALIKSVDLEEYVRGVAFTADGSRIFTAMGNGEVLVLDGCSLETQATLEGHLVDAKGVDLSSDGATLASAARDRHVVLWSTADLSLLKVLKGHTGGVNSVRFHPKDPTCLASASDDGTIILWSTACDKPLLRLTGHTSVVHGLAFSPGGKLLASGSFDGSVRLWDAATGKQVAALEGHGDAVYAVAFSPKGSLLASGAQDRTVLVWDVAQHLPPDDYDPAGDEEETLAQQLGSGLAGKDLKGIVASRRSSLHAAGAIPVQPAPKAFTLAARPSSTRKSGSGAMAVRYNRHAEPDQTLTKFISNTSAALAYKQPAWDSSCGREVSLSQGHSGSVWCCQFSPDGSKLATSSRDTSVQLWDVETGQQLGVLRGHHQSVNCVSWAPDSVLLVSCSEDSSVRLWCTRRWRELRRLNGHVGGVWGVNFAPDGRTLASCSEDRLIRLWCAATGEELGVCEGHEDQIYGVNWSPNGRKLASGSNDFHLRVWDVESRTQLWAAHAHDSTLGTWDTAFSPSGNTIATAGHDGLVKVWDAELGVLLQTLTHHKGPAYYVSFSPNGRWLATASEDMTIGILNTSTYEMEQILTGHTDGIPAVNWKPDGTCLASCSHDNTVRVWEVETWKELRVIEESYYPIWSFCKLGAVCLVASASGSEVHVVDASANDLVCALSGHTDRVSCTLLSRDGSILVSGSLDCTARVWGLPQGAELRVLAGHTAGVRCVELSPNKALIATGSWDKTARIWDTHTGGTVCVLRGHKAEVMCLAFTTDGEQVVTGAESSVFLWDSRTGQLLHLLQGHEGRVTSVCFSLLGDYLVSTSQDNVLCIWRVDGGRCQALQTQPGSLACISSGMMFAVNSVCVDVYLAFEPTYSVCVPFAVRGRVEGIAFHSGVLVASSGSELYIYEVPEGEV